MEDINFKKFICYILNCIGATEDTKITVFYVDKDLKKIDYNAGASKIAYDDLKHTYADDAAAGAAAGAGAVVAAVVANSIYTTLNDNASNIKQYFNIKQVPSYITIKGNKQQLDVSQSIHQAFNLIKVFFDAKKWYLSQYDNTQNKMSYSSINFRNDNQMYGGFKIAYDKANNEVDDATSSYDKFLANVLRDFIYMVSGETDKIDSFDVTTLYVLSKINYYLAKRYAVLSINKNPKDFYDALKEYNQIVAYDNSFFDNFTYYNKPLDAKDYPRYYQKQILDLLNVVNPTTDVNDVLSYLLVTETNEQISEVDNPISYDDFHKKINYLDIYKSLFDKKTFESNYNEINTRFNNIHSIMQKIITCANNFHYTKIDTLTIKTISTTINGKFEKSNIYNNEINKIINVLTTITIAAINLINNKFDDVKGIADVVDAVNDAINAVDGDVIADADTNLVAIIRVIVVAGVAALRSYYAGDNANDVAAAVTAAKQYAERTKDAIIVLDADVTNAANAAYNGANSITNAIITDAVNGIDNQDDKAKAIAIAIIVHIVTDDNVINNRVNDEINKINNHVTEDIRKIIKSYIQYGVATKNINNIISTINGAKCKISKIQDRLTMLINTINEHKSNHVAALFKAIKTYIKKYSKDTFSSVYQSPTISYSLTPMNIRPLIVKRATETDLSNYAAQIASDSFLNSNKLPAIPEIKTLNGAPGIIGLMKGGSTDINNSSNVYRAIFNKILTTLNSKKIKLNEADKQKVDESLDKLEQTEHYLKSTLSDYAKYASVPHIKGETIRYNDVRKFVNEYENKLREYNKNSAHMLRFIGKLTRYLII